MPFLFKSVRELIFDIFHIYSLNIFICMWIIGKMRHHSLFYLTCL